MIDGRYSLLTQSPRKVVTDGTTSAFEEQESATHSVIRTKIENVQPSIEGDVSVAIHTWSQSGQVATLDIVATWSSGTVEGYRYVASFKEGSGGGLLLDALSWDAVGIPPLADPS